MDLEASRSYLLTRHTIQRLSTYTTMTSIQILSILGYRVVTLLSLRNSSAVFSMAVIVYALGLSVAACSEGMAAELAVLYVKEDISPLRGEVGRISVSSDGKRLAVVRRSTEKVFAFEEAPGGNAWDVVDIPSDIEHDKFESMTELQGGRWFAHERRTGAIACLSTNQDGKAMVDHRISTVGEDRPKQSVHATAFAPRSLFYIAKQASNCIWVGKWDANNKPFLVQYIVADVSKVKGGTAKNVKVTECTSLDGPSSINLSFDGNDLYVTSFRNHTLLHFRVSKADGSLDLARTYARDILQRERPPASRGLTYPIAVETTPEGLQLAVGGIGNAVTLFSRDLSDGSIKFDQTLSDPLGVSSDQLYVRSIRISSTGKLIAVACGQSNSICIYRRDNYGKWTCLRVLKSENDPGDILRGVSDAVWSTDGKSLFVTSETALFAAISLGGIE